MMNFDRARAIADAVMMEGYALYPYRASAPKNRFRWTFGVLAPRGWSENGGCEPWWLEAQILATGPATRINGLLRFFQVDRRRVFDRASRPVEGLELPDGLAVSWDEGVEHVVEVAIPDHPSEQHVTIEGARSVEHHTDGMVQRERISLAGRIYTRRERVPAEHPLTRITIRIENVTPWIELDASRTNAILGAFASTHLLIGVEDGELLSAIDPPAWAPPACTNVRTYPVLVGAPGTHSMMLAAPIILYDHPQLAPESPGDLCDASEIDELLVLRTRTMTDDEKRAARATDPRAAEIVDRAERIPTERMARLHGASRDRSEGEMVPVVPEAGRKVRLRPPTKLTDAQDLFYVGKVATVAEVREDVDGSIFLAVTIDDDPAAELHDWYGRYHHYRLDEVELL